MSKTPRQDWHWEDVKAALRKRGWTINRIGRERGYSHPDSPRRVRLKPWPLMERVIADLLDMQPREIWPSRYNADGTPKGRGIRGEYSKSPVAGNSKASAAA